MASRKLGGLLSVMAFCDDCEWEQGARNGMGLAAQHHYKTGHTTHVESSYTMTFCTEESPVFQRHLARQAKVKSA